MCLCGGRVGQRCKPPLGAALHLFVLVPAVAGCRARPQLLRRESSSQVWKACPLAVDHTQAGPLV